MPVEPVKVSLSDILCHLSNQGTFMFFAKVISALPVQRTTMVPIIGIQLTTSGYMLLINEEGIDKIPGLEFLIMLIEHEVHHVVLEHASRAVRKAREVTNLIEQTYILPVLRISEDLAVNDQLKNYSKHSEQMLHSELGGCVPGHPPFEKMPRGLMFEQYFDLIMKKALDERSKLKPMFDMMKNTSDKIKEQPEEFKAGFAAGYRDVTIEKASKS